MKFELSTLLLCMAYAFTLGFVTATMLKEGHLNLHTLKMMKDKTLVAAQILFWFLISGTITFLAVLAYGLRS